MLSCLEEPSSCRRGRKAPSSCQCLHDTRSSHASEKGLVSKPCQSRSTITIEYILTPFYLSPIYPRRDCVHFFPQLRQFGMLRMVVPEQGIQISLRHR